MSKVTIKFLQLGEIEVDTPNNFNEMSLDEKRVWADDILNNKTVTEIIQALSSYHSEVGFDDIMCEAIINKDGEAIIKSSVYEIYSENEIEWKKGTGELK